MRRKLVAIWKLLKCNNYLLITYKSNSLHYDHTLHEKDATKYCQRLVDHYELQNLEQEEVLAKAKRILGL